MKIENFIVLGVLIGSLFVACISAFRASYSDLLSRGTKSKIRPDVENEVMHDVSKSRLSTYTDVMYLLLKRKKLFKPWLLLPNHAECYQEPCRENADCCRGYNICDASANVCIDCWYGYPCKTDADCCEDYPKCAQESPNSDYGRCGYVGGKGK